GSTFQLYMVLSATGTRTQLTGRSGQVALVNVGRPSWNETGTLIAFCAQRRDVPGDNYGLYVVDVATFGIRGVVVPGPKPAGGSGPGVECVDAAWRHYATTPPVDTITFASTGTTLNGIGIFNTAVSG